MGKKKPTQQGQPQANSSKPASSPAWYQKLLVSLLASLVPVGAGVLIFGEWLDAFSNAAALIRPLTTVIGTIVLIALMLSTGRLLRAKFVQHLANNRIWASLGEFGMTPKYMMLGFIILLWVPRGIEAICWAIPPLCPASGDNKPEQDLQIRPTPNNEQLTAEAQKKFYIRLPTSLIFNYPGPILYVYNSKFGRLIAPIGYAAVMEVANNRDTITKIQSFVLDVEYDQRWFRLHHLLMQDPLSTYWVRDGDLSKCTQLDFSSNSFDIQAKAKELLPGQSVRGWVFFEWPPELRDKAPHISRIRVKVENTQGEEETLIIASSRKEEEGKASMEGGGIRFLQKDAVDLSKLEIMPHVDLLRGFREGTLK